MITNLRLFFITCATDDGESLDWFVAANDKAEAVSLWRKIDMVKDLGITEPGAVFVIVPAKLEIVTPKVLGWHEYDQVEVAR